MKINFYTFKFLTSFILLMFVNVIFAQTPDQTIPLGTSTDFNYSVDTSSDPSNPTLDDQLNGTSGSTYTWTIELVSGTVIGTFPAAGAYNNQQASQSLTDNKATINWSNSTPGDYLVKVVETNNNCPPEEVNFIVRIEIPRTATGNVGWTSTSICKGDQVTFNISGVNPNSTLHYSLTNATTNTGTVLIDSNGDATVTVTHDNTNANTVTITLEKVVINETDILFSSPNPTETATINIIVTSPIQLLP